MTNFLYSKSSDHVTLATAIDNCKQKLNKAIALIYSPNFCQLLKLENDGNLYDSQNNLVNINYQDSYIFSACIFNQDYELRWLNENNGQGKAVIISEQNIGNCLDNEIEPLEIIETIPQQYLLWGERAKTQLNEGWQRLSTARIGSLDVAISQLLNQDQRVYLNTIEYLKIMDDYGNVSVVEERLINLEVK